MNTKENNHTCPICNSELSSKLSGKGKYFGLSCHEHGFVKIINHPLMNQIETKRPSFKNFVNEFAIELCIGFIFFSALAIIAYK